MPCILKIRVLSCRDLPVMDKSAESTDAYVEVHFGEYDTLRTQVCKRSLNPVFNEDFRFEVSDDSELQNEPLEIKVYDYDTISSSDPIGTVMIDLNPLLAWEALEEEGVQPEKERMLTGWFPIYDSLLGIRGEISLQGQLVAVY
jgi:Ca2+-dependent lipid-binding protein